MWLKYGLIEFKGKHVNSGTYLSRGHAEHLPPPQEAQGERPSVLQPGQRGRGDARGLAAQLQQSVNHDGHFCCSARALDVGRIWIWTHQKAYLGSAWRLRRRVTIPVLLLSQQKCFWALCQIPHVVKFDIHIRTGENVYILEVSHLGTNKLLYSAPLR